MNKDADVKETVKTVKSRDHCVSIGSVERVHWLEMYLIMAVVARMGATGKRTGGFWDPPYSLHTMCECVRISRGWSRSLVLERLGIDAGTYARWADGGDLPHADAHERVERCFGVRFVLDARGRIMGIDAAAVGGDDAVAARMRRSGVMEAGDVDASPSGGCARIDEVIDAHLHESQLPAALVAEALGCDGTAVEHMVRGETGLAWEEHVWTRRLARARMLLEEGESSVGEVARRCGFRYDASFSRAFRRRYGLTPRDFRRGRRHARGA